jgi:hypothetical protein
MLIPGARVRVIEYASRERDFAGCTGVFKGITSCPGYAKVEIDKEQAEALRDRFCQDLYPVALVLSDNVEVIEEVGA